MYEYRVCTANGNLKKIQLLEMRIAFLTRDQYPQGCDEKKKLDRI